MLAGDTNGGVYGAIRRAISLGRRMVTGGGMNERVGFVFYGEDENKLNYMDFGGTREYSDETAKTIDEEVKKLIDGLYQETIHLLEGNKDRIDAIAKALLKYETLDASDIERLMRGDVLTKPTVGDLLAKAQIRRATTIQPAENPTEPDIHLHG